MENRPEGFYDHERAENPFAEYWHVVVPYCTGDIHWGNATVEYEGDSPVTIHHRGAVNTRSVLDWVYEQFEAPDRMLVTGCSAGSYGSALWSTHVMHHYPDTQVLQFGDSGAGVITDSFFRESFPSWNALEAFPSWIPSLDPAMVDPLELQLDEFYIRAANAYPTQRMSQYNTYIDENQTFFFVAMGGSGAEEWSSRMRASVAAIEEGAENFYSFMPSGEQHCILGADNFYTVDAGGVLLTDWLAELEDGGSPASAACPDDTACRAPTP